MSADLPELALELSHLFPSSHMDAALNSAAGYRLDSFFSSGF